MIPRKIHYCWFGRGEKPRLAQKCIASWKKYCPDYEIIEWNEDNFDVNRNAYTRMCYKEKKYAFLTDYLRLLITQKPNDYPEIRVLLRKLINEVNAIGNNINQITRNHNSHIYRREDKELLTAYMKKLNLMVQEVSDKIGNQ